MRLQTHIGNIFSSSVVFYVATTLYSNYPHAQVCFEKRLVIAHELKESEAEAYGELGDIHRLLANYDQAVTCMQHRISLAR
jgi:hypothetical protein